MLLWIFYFVNSLIQMLQLIVENHDLESGWFSG
jgi:hypothetical protein